ncbi:MAG: ABC transporter C-terminal domain-containing protein, partial [bacterium]|nr:ABC transporter C-terminal domain-containing protein [bacterium]
RKTDNQPKNGKQSKGQRRQADQQQEKLLARIETAEARMQEIDAAFCAPRFYDNTPANEVKDLQIERSELEREVESLTAEWERAEANGFSN